MGLLKRLGHGERRIPRRRRKAGNHAAMKRAVGTDITLRWMLDEAVNAGLLAIHTPESAGDPCSPVHESLTGVWWLLEFVPKRYVDMTCTPPQVRWRIPLGSPRRMPEGSVLHRSLEERMRNSEYHPSNLPKSYTFDGTVLAPCKPKAAIEAQAS